jgi:hypothetical protein
VRARLPAGGVPAPRATHPGAARARVRARVRVNCPTRCSGGKVANRVTDFGRGVAHGVDTRRPPICLDTVVARTGGLRVRRFALGFVQGALSVAAVPSPTVTISQRACVSPGARVRSRGVHGEILLHGARVSASGGRGYASGVRVLCGSRCWPLWRSLAAGDGHQARQRQRGCRHNPRLGTYNREQAADGEYAQCNEAIVNLLDELTPAAAARTAALKRRRAELSGIRSLLRNAPPPAEVRCCPYRRVRIQGRGRVRIQVHCIS